MNFDEKLGAALLRRRSNSLATCLTTAEKEGWLSVLLLRRSGMHGVCTAR